MDLLSGNISGIGSFQGGECPENFSAEQMARGKKNTEFFFQEWSD